jgi:phosphatidylglycerophosphate synthase
VREETFGAWDASIITLLLICGFFAAALLYYCVLGLFGKRPRSAEMAARGETVFLPLYVREWWDWVISPVTRLLISLRVSPNAITLFSCAISAVAGVAFAFGRFGLGGWLYVLGGTCDMFDGKVARATGRESHSGAFMDSVLDRYTEIFVLSGLAYFFRSSSLIVVVMLAMAGSLMVSYTRARGEGLGYSCREGGMQRAERIVYLGVAGILGSCAQAIWPGHSWATIFMTGCLTMMAVSTNMTALHRFFAIIRALKSAEGGPHQEGTVIKLPFLRKIQT